MTLRHRFDRRQNITSIVACVTRCAIPLTESRSERFDGPDISILIEDESESPTEDRTDESTLRRSKKQKKKKKLHRAYGWRKCPPCIAIRSLFLSGDSKKLGRSNEQKHIGTCSRQKADATGCSSICIQLRPSFFLSLVNAKEVDKQNKIKKKDKRRRVDRR